MTDKTKEVLRLALEALENAEDQLAKPYSTGARYAITAIREALALVNKVDQEQPAIKQDLTPEQPAPNEPDWLDKEQTETDWDHVWLLIKAASYASSKGFISGTTNWGSAVSRYMRNESPQPAPVAEPRKPQQEPHGYLKLSTAKFFHEVEGTNPMTDKNYLPLYTSPPTLSLAQRQSRSDVKPWVGLTDVERIELMESTHPKNRWPLLALCEEKLREKNA